MASDAGPERRRAPRRLSFGPDRRLARRADFERLLREGVRRSLSGYTFYLARRGDQDPPRLGILVSRKHARQATERNRIKRRIREAFRLEQDALKGFDVLVRPPYGGRPLGAMVLRLRELFSRLNR